jgi:hypothetical protein
MAAQDVLIWQEQAAGTLPAGQVTVNFDNAAVPPTYEIAVNWTEPQGPQNYTVQIPVIGN